jgi:cardiolipin synthase A/B
VLHRGFAQQQRQVFDADWGKARKVSLEAWQNRPLPERAQERQASLLSSQL